jgi:hypothetical protein
MLPLQPFQDDTEAKRKRGVPIVHSKILIILQLRLALCRLLVFIHIASFNSQSSAHTYS